MEEALKELVSHYSDDRIAPGIQLAWLQERGTFYAAIHQFPLGVESRTVVAKGLAPTVELAVETAMANWRKIVT